MLRRRSDPSMARSRPISSAARTAPSADHPGRSASVHWKSAWTRPRRPSWPMSLARNDPPNVTASRGSTDRSSQVHSTCCTRSASTATGGQSSGASSSPLPTSSGSSGESACSLSPTSGSRRLPRGSRVSLPRAPSISTRWTRRSPRRSALTSTSTFRYSTCANNSSEVTPLSAAGSNRRFHSSRPAPRKERSKSSYCSSKPCPRATRAANQGRVHGSVSRANSNNTANANTTRLVQRHQRDRRFGGAGAASSDAAGSLGESLTSPPPRRARQHLLRVRSGGASRSARGSKPGTCTPRRNNQSWARTREAGLASSSEARFSVSRRRWNAARSALERTRSSSAPRVLPSSPACSSRSAVNSGSASSSAFTHASACNQAARSSVQRCALSERSARTSSAQLWARAVHPRSSPVPIRSMAKGLPNAATRNPSAARFEAPCWAARAATIRSTCAASTCCSTAALSASAVRSRLRAVSTASADGGSSARSTIHTNARSGAAAKGDSSATAMGPSSSSARS